MSPKDAIVDFLLIKNNKGKNGAWPWLGEYCAVATFRKDFSHPRILVSEKKVVPGLRMDMRSALAKISFSLHIDPQYSDTEIVVAPLHSSDKKYLGFQLVMEVDGDPDTNLAFAKLMGEKAPSTREIAKVARQVLEKAFEQ